MIALGASGSRRTRHFLLKYLGILLLVVIWLYTFVAPRTIGVGPMTTKVLEAVHVQAYSAKSKTYNLDFLEKQNLSSTISYRQRYIKTKYFDGERLDLTIINGSLFNAAQNIDLKNLTKSAIRTLPPLTLHIPRSAKNDPTILSFGIATSIPRLRDSLPSFEHWLVNTSCSLQVLSPPRDDDILVEQELLAKGINITITPTTLPFPKAYFSLVKTLYETRSPNTKWLVLLDDDTFFPSLPKMVEHLATTYDHTKEVLVSAISDDLDQIRDLGLIPFGGGGIFISVPLAAHLTMPEIWDKCIGSKRNEGDQMLNECLNEHTIVRPSFDALLNQMDIRGAGIEAGYFESGRRMLTVHHWKSWYHHNITATALVSKAAKEESILMRFLFSQPNIVLSNGYSIAEYPLGFSSNNPSTNGEDEGLSQYAKVKESKELKKNQNSQDKGSRVKRRHQTKEKRSEDWDIDLSKVECTWDQNAPRYIHKFPLRKKLGRDKKISYKMVETEVLDGIGVRQVYIDRANLKGEVDGVMVLVWLF